MNPKISITIDAKNKAIASLVGMVTVGAKVDVEVRGITPESVPDWASDDDFTGKSLRFRIVDGCGHDLVRFPLVMKSGDSDGDRWTVAEDGAFVTQSEAAGSPVVNFNTDRLRSEFRGVAFNDSLEFGVILDSIVDDVQYAVGKIKVRQWSACPTDDPTILPDWRMTLNRLRADLEDVRQSKDDAEIAKDAAVAAKDESVAAMNTAQSLAGAALNYKNDAQSSANAAGASASSAGTSASSAATSANRAAEQVSKYPYIDSTTNHWMVWDAENEKWSDTGVVAEGQDGEPGQPGVGVPAGGAAGKVLAKKSGADYDMEWVDQQGGGVDVAGKLPLKPLPKFLHYLEFDDTYPADAEWLYGQLGPNGLGMCSAVRRGGKLYRNYDWTFDNAAEFVVKVSGNATRFASVGVASVGSLLNENDVMSAVNSRYYRCLPGMTLDGINDKGVVCEINVDGGPKNDWHGDVDDDGIHIAAAVRWVLDHGETAQQAAEWIADHIIQPTGEMNFHFMVADNTKTYIVENGVAHDVTDGTKVLTNYALYDESHAGGGKERYTLLANDANAITAAWFTNAYKSGNTWHSDFDSEEQHAEAIEQWAAQGTDKEAHRGKTTAGGRAWWQSVHTAEYDFAAKTMKVAVQEVDDWYVFAVGAVAGYEPPAGGIPKTDLAQGVQESLERADNAVQLTGEESQTIEGELHVDSVAVDGWRIEVVDEIPAHPIAGTIYLVKEAAS